MKFGNSLTAKLVKIFLGVYVVVAVGVTGYHLFAVFRNETKFVFAELEKLREYSEPVLAEALWQFNDAGLESSVKILGASPEAFEFPDLKIEGTKQASGN